MRLINYILLFVFCLTILNGCKSLHSGTSENTPDFMINKEIILVKTIPGGSRAHIIHISEKGNLSYRIGSILNLDEYENKDVVFDKKYKEVKTNLDSKIVSALVDLLEDEKSLSYFDKSVVKDNLQYYLYLNNEKKSFGYENNFNEYPVNLKSLINLILKETGRLHKIPGMS